MYLKEYMISNHNTRASGTCATERYASAGIVASVYRFLCCLHTASADAARDHPLYTGCCCKLAALIDDTGNGSRISTASDTVHNHRSDCHFSFVALRTCL